MIYARVVANPCPKKFLKKKFKPHFILFSINIILFNYRLTWFNFFIKNLILSGFSFPGPRGDSRRLNYLSLIFQDTGMSLHRLFLSFNFDYTFVVVNDFYWAFLCLYSQDSSPTQDRKSTCLNSSHNVASRMPSSA